MKPPSIAIIGGGPSGLVFARLLELSRITDYVVFERDESSTPGPWQQGGTLDLHGPSGQLALKRAGLFDEFSKKLARWDASCLHVVDPAGKTVASFSGGRDAPEIDRLLATSSIERREDDDIAGKDNKYIIRFANGTSATGFRLIVGADGAWSKVRPLITPAKPVYSGKMYIEGRISHNNPSYARANEMAGPGSMLAIGNQKKIALQQVADGTYRVYFGLIVPEDFYNHHHHNNNSNSKNDNNIVSTDLASKTEAIRHLLLSSGNLYSAWAPSLKSFVENSEGPFRSWPLYRMEPEAVGWVRKVARGVTLLGDAAHVSTPFVGEGVNCSMYDAVMLADSIITHCGKGASLADYEEAVLEEALASYEEEMFVRGRDLIRRSTDSEKMLFSDNAPALFLDFFNAAGTGKDFQSSKE